MIYGILAWLFASSSITARSARAAGLAPTGAPGTTASANGRIAYSSNQSGSYEIWTMDTTGAHQVRLTNTVGIGVVEVYNRGAPWRRPIPGDPLDYFRRAASRGGAADPFNAPRLSLFDRRFFRITLFPFSL